MRYGRFYLFFLFCLAFQGAAMDVTGFNTVSHDRFSSGFPSSPAPNSSADFTGAGYDWSGVGWASSPATKGFGFVSPQHYLVARHFGGSSLLRIFGADGQLHERSQRNVVNTDFGVVFSGQTLGDLSLGALQESFPLSAMPVRYGVLDLNSSSTSNSTTAYSNRPLLIYGRGPNSSSSPRVAATPLVSVTVSGNNHFFTTGRGDLQLQDGDSGSPAFTSWVNPDGQAELAILGNHAAINETNNFHSFLGTHQVMGALSNLMRPDGRALRVVGSPAYTWVGSSSENINRNSAWGLGGNPNSTGATSDAYVLFDADTASSTMVTVNTDYALRGVYLRGNASFQFAGSNTLTVRRGGITVYGDRSHFFSAPLALGADQVWNAGQGMLSLQNLNVNTWLLEVLGDGVLNIQGNITGGSGGLAVGGGELHIGGNATYTGTTWVHAGLLRVDGDVTSSAAVVLGDGAVLTGSGRLPELRGRGRVKPSGTVLTATALNGSAGLSFDFTFADSTPAGNETLRLTSATPFTAALSASSSIRVFLDAEALAPGQRFRGGFFTDASADFLSALQSATFEIYVWEGGDYQLLSDPDLDPEWSTGAYTFDFGDGMVEGRVLTLGFVPPPDTYARWVYEVFPIDTPPEDTDPYAAPNTLGIPNLASYGHGLNPLAPDLGLRPVSLLEEGDFVFRWWQNPAALDATPRVEGTGDLTGPWGDPGLTPAWLGQENGLDLYEVRLPPGDLLFLRVFWILDADQP